MEDIRDLFGYRALEDWLTLRKRGKDGGSLEDRSLFQREVERCGLRICVTSYSSL